jgi:hypothetical protein
MKGAHLNPLLMLKALDIVSFSTIHQFLQLQKRTQ